MSSVIQKIKERIQAKKKKKGPPQIKVTQLTRKWLNNAITFIFISAFHMDAFILLILSFPWEYYVLYSFLGKSTTAKIHTMHSDIVGKAANSTCVALVSITTMGSTGKLPFLIRRKELGLLKCFFSSEMKKTDFCETSL